MNAYQRLGKCFKVRDAITSLLAVRNARPKHVDSSSAVVNRRQAFVGRSRRQKDDGYTCSSMQPHINQFPYMNIFEVRI